VRRIHGRIAPGINAQEGEAVVRARLEATIMCGLIVKCALLAVLIQLFRALGKFGGPRYSGLALGLPSTTVVVLIFCGCEHGSLAATEMAESSVLGLVAAVSLPLVFAGAVRLEWPLWGAIGASVGGYLLVAATLGFLPAIGAMPKVIVAATALAGAASWVGRIRGTQTCGDGGRVALSGIRTVVLRTATPVVYVILLGMFERLAGPSWAGLMSTFPSLSLVVLVVTYLEAGPGESSRVAQVLPCGNLSTLAFLAVFRFVCEGAGVGWATAAGYGAALAALLVIQRFSGMIELARARVIGVNRSRVLGRIVWRCGAEVAPWLRGLHIRLRGVQVCEGSRGRPARRLGRRCGFLPLVETLAW
jgi:hypothetical protein